MKNYFNEINVKLNKQIKIEKITIVDNSHKHKGHKFFSPEKLHLKLIIKSLYLQSISRINAQKLIMRILKEDLNTKIHALEIKIE
jgi:BolA protein|tara:strand:- start:610 stop:864 length:255 start_codon:yes stop_codon:yes gene_type:complete